MLTGRSREVRCTHVPESCLRPGHFCLKVQGVIHWLSAGDAVQAEVRLYDRSFVRKTLAAEEDFKATLNPNSLTVLENAMIEPSLA